MKISKVTHAELLKMLDVMRVLEHFEERFEKSIYQRGAEKTAKYFTQFIKRNKHLISDIDLVLIGYDALVTAACDPNAKCLEFRPDIEKYLENKDAVDEFIAKLEREKQEGAE